MAPDQLLSALQWRYATKRFDSSQIIPKEAWDVLEQSLRLTPSSFGLQPWKFLVVRTPSLREKLRGQSWDQSQVTDASHLVVFAVRTDITTADIDAWITCLAETNGKSPADFDMLRGMIVGFSEAMTSGQRHEWNKRQAYIALGQLMAASAVLGIDACPLEGIHAGGYDEILGLADSGYSVCVACALGYRDASDQYASAPKARFPRSVVTETL